MRESDIRPTALMEEFFVRLKRDAERLAARRDAFVRVSCSFCGTDDPEPAFIKDGFQYQLCRLCGSLYTSPRPSYADLVDYAINSEAVMFWSTRFYNQTAAARREKIFRPRAALIAELVEKGVVEQTETLVEIGAGYGLFLQELSALNVFQRIVGIEPDANLAAICRASGFAIIEKWIEDLTEGELAADCAICFEVMEHVFDPCAFLRACARTLRPGGVLFFTTLTINGFDMQVLWENARQISPPQHLNFPSIQGAHSLIERCGLELIDLSTPGQLDVDIVSNMLTANPQLDVPRFARTIALADENTRRDFQAFLQVHQLSSHLLCLVRKPL